MGHSVNNYELNIETCTISQIEIHFWIFCQKAKNKNSSIELTLVLWLITKEINLMKLLYSRGLKLHLHIFVNWPHSWENINIFWPYSYSLWSLWVQINIPSHFTQNQSNNFFDFGLYIYLTWASTSSWWGHSKRGEEKT